MRSHAARLATLAILSLHGAALAREPPPVHDEAPETDEATFAPPGTLRTYAESVSFDARERTLELSGDVRLDSPPFHLRSQHLTISRTRWGIEVEGEGTLAFCPCLGTPLTVQFDEAIIAPPGDLILRAPKLRIYGVPVLVLPWFWLRSDDKPGVLPPDIAYRGRDGLFLGGGVHLPWRDGGDRRSLDVRGGVYLSGGFAAGARLRSPSSSTSVRYERVTGSRAPRLFAGEGGSSDDALFVEARGARDGGGGAVAWDADMIRGRRGVASTTELDAAAKPWDRASGSGALRLGPATLTMGARAVTRRGGDLTSVDASGPFAALRSSGALGANATYDATLEGGGLRLSGPAASAAGRASETLSYARAEIGALAAARAGPVAAQVSARGAGDVAAEGRRSGADRAAGARARVGLPLARAFRSSRANDDPLVHLVEPFAEAALLHAHGDGLLGTAPGRAASVVSGTAPLAAGGIRSTLGRWGRREALEIALASGTLLGPEPARVLGRATISASFEAFAAQAIGAQVGRTTTRGPGAAVVGRVRVGRTDGVRLLTNVAAQAGLDPVSARALTDAPLAPPTGLLAREGTTGGAELAIPWSRGLSTSFGADADMTRQTLVGVRGGVALRDACRCLTLRVDGAHRIGREGVDVWIALDFTTER